MRKMWNTRRKVMNKARDKVECPFCELPVTAYSEEHGGPDYSISVFAFYHANGEMHFVVNQPQGSIECPQEQSAQ